MERVRGVPPPLPSLRRDAVRWAKMSGGKRFCEVDGTSPCMTLFDSLSLAGPPICENGLDKQRGTSQPEFVPFSPLTLTLFLRAYLLLVGKLTDQLHPSLSHTLPPPLGPILLLLHAP